MLIHRRGWLRFGGAILFFLLIASASLAACAPTASPASGEPGGSGAASQSPAGPTPAPSAPTASEAFAAALAPFRVAAEFTTTVTVGDTAVATSAGRSVGASRQLTVTSDGRTVEYVQVPPAAWARETGGTWVLLTPDQAPADPLETLAAPTSIAADPGSGTDGSGPIHLTAVYPAAALGLSGDPVSVAIVIDAGTLTFRYETTVGEQPASSVTVLQPASTTDPIVAPIP